MLWVLKALQLNINYAVQQELLQYPPFDIIVEVQVYDPITNMRTQESGSLAIADLATLKRGEWSKWPRLSTRELYYCTNEICTYYTPDPLYWRDLTAERLTKFITEPPKVPRVLI